MKLPRDLSGAELIKLLCNTDYGQVIIAVKTWMTKTLEREIGRTVRQKRQQLSVIREEVETFWIIWIFWKRARTMPVSHALAMTK